MRYDVIAYENWEFNPKDLYDLTFNLSFIFFNYQNSIKLPGPLMYAHTLVNQVKKILGNKEDCFETPANFENKLYAI